MRYGLAGLFVLAAAAAWGVFRMPGDGGRPLVSISGRVRFALELAIFALAVGALISLGDYGVAAAIAAAVIVHYSLSYDRVGRMLRRSDVRSNNAAPP